MDKQQQANPELVVSAREVNPHRVLFVLAQLLPVLIVMVIMSFIPIFDNVFFISYLLSCVVLALVINVAWSKYIFHKSLGKVIVLSVLQIVIAYAFLFLGANCFTPFIGEKIGIICESGPNWE